MALHLDRSFVLGLVLSGVLVGAACGKERDFSSDVAPLEGNESSTTPEPPPTPGPDANAPAGVPGAGDDMGTAGSARCASNEDCSTSAARVCDQATGACTACLGSADCASDKPFCKLDPSSSTRNACVQCTRDAECPSLAPVCDLSTNECTSRCQDSAQCSGATPLCDPVAQVCVQCLANADCATPTPACDSTTARCVECVDGSTCASGTFCNTNARTCVGCLETSQCLDEFNAHCQTDPALPSPFTCIGCVEDRDCSTKDGLGTLCRLNDGKCVECLTDAECTSNPNATSCSPLGTCGACVTDVDCAAIPGRTACLAGAGCVECTNSAQCSGNPRGPLCKTTTTGDATDTAPLNTCVECTSDTDCTDPTASACQNNACVPCQSNANCSHVNSTPGVGGGTPLNICDAGSCVQCTGLQREACGANVCDSLAKTCTNRPAGLAGLCDECVSDAECSPDARCVSLAFAESPTGNFCVPTPVDGSCGSRRPFSGASSGTTLDSATPTALCVLRATTCPGLNDVSAACSSDTDCGADGVADGLCVAFGDGNACTTPCNGGIDCLAACSAQGDVNACEF